MPCSVTVDSISVGTVSAWTSSFIGFLVHSFLTSFAVFLSSPSKVSSCLSNSTLSPTVFCLLVWFLRVFFFFFFLRGFDFEIITVGYPDPPEGL